ncbi:MAG: hypothetical protein KW788_03150 [Candidatus Doudnabacteria bacterium]|nr:hypothetical protein [Candidatus Doudnabacteria bacterium]
MIPYGKIFQQAFAILRTHKFLWGLGLFLFWDLGVNAVTFRMKELPQPSTPHISPAAVAIGVVILVIFIQLFFRARAGLILGTKSILDRKPLNFSKSLRGGGKYYFRLFTIWIFTILLLIVSGLILAAPVSYLYSINYSERASLLGLFALFIFIPLAVTLNFANNIAPLFAVLFDLRPRAAIAASLDMIKKFWLVFLVFTIWLGLISFLAVLLAVSLGSAGVVFLGQIFYNTAGIHLSTSSVLLGIAGIAAFLFFAGAIAAYQQIAWVLLFDTIVRPQKIEEEEALPVPGVIS